MTRTTRGHGTIVLGERDHEILLFVGLMGAGVTVEHLTLAFFTGADRARVRTRQLVRAGYLESWLIDSRIPRVLTLSAAGLAHAKAQFGELAPRLFRARPVQALALAHASAVVWSRMYLAALSEAGLLSVGLSPASQNAALCDVQEHRINGISQRSAELVRFVAPHEPDFARFGFARFGLRPDGLAEVAPRDLGHPTGGRAGDENQPSLIALEVDLGTEVLDTIRSKVERYTRAFADRALDEVWFFADGGRQRLTSLARVVEGARGALICRIVEYKWTQERPIVPPVALLAYDATTLVYDQHAGEGARREAAHSRGLKP